MKLFTSPIKHRTPVFYSLLLYIALACFTSTIHGAMRIETKEAKIETATEPALLEDSQDLDLKKIAHEIIDECIKEAKSGSPIKIFYNFDEPYLSNQKKELSDSLVKIMQATKQQFPDTQQLKTFTAYSAGGLRAEYPTLKALHNIGFKDIKIINIADLYYDDKKTESPDAPEWLRQSNIETKKAIAFFTKEAKELFPGCIVNVYNSNKAHREACKTNEALKSNFVVMSRAYDAFIDSSCAQENALVAVIWTYSFMVKLADFEKDAIPLNAEIFSNFDTANGLKKALKSSERSSEIKVYGYHLDACTEFMKLKKEKYYPKLLQYPDIKEYIDVCEEAFAPIKNIGEIFGKYRVEKDFGKRAALVQQLVDTAKTEGIQLEGIDSSTEELVKLIITLAKKEPVSVSNDEYKGLLEILSPWKKNNKIHEYMWPVGFLLDDFIDQEDKYWGEKSNMMQAWRDELNKVGTKELTLTKEFKEKFIALIQWIHDHLKE